MTPAQRQYDLDLVASMYKMAAWIEPRSRKVSDTLRVAASRIAALTGSLPDTATAQLDLHGNKVQLDPRGGDHPSLSDPENKIQPRTETKSNRTKIKSSPRQRRIKNR